MVEQQKIVLLYIFFICLNIGFLMLSSTMVEVWGGSCPIEGEEFDDEIHHKACKIGVQFPEELEYDASPQSSDVCDLNEPSCDNTTLLQRTVNDTDGNLYDILISDNGTSIDTSEVKGDGGFFDDISNFFGGVEDTFSFVTDITNALQFGATILLNTFTGGFILDVLSAVSSETGLANFPQVFLTGFKILIGIAVVSWFAYLILGK